MTHDTKDVDRFWSHVNKIPNGCWEWTGYTGGNRYGGFHIENRRSPSGARNRGAVSAHRFSFLLTFGPIGELCVLHRCDNRKCVNPDHLFLGTNTRNIEDKVSKGRAPKGLQQSNAKLTEPAVVSIRERYARGDTSQRALAKEFGINQTMVRLVLSRRRWKHVS